MTLNSLVMSEEYSTENDNETTTYLPLGEYPNYALYYISTMFANIGQVKTNLNAQHQHEKHEIIQLNEGLRDFIDCVQQLELQNAKYAAILADFWQQSSGIRFFGTELDERTVHLQADLMTINHKIIDYEFEFELFQMQSEIYKQLINVVNQSNDEQRSKLQQELDESSSTLISLRTSYEKLEKNIENLQAQHEDTFKQYLEVAHNWGHWKKQITESKANMQALKNQLVFYKNIRSHVTSDSFSMETFDMKQFWALKWEKIIKNIRHDYELLYASAHRETVAYYEKKTKEVQVEVEQANVQQIKYYQEVESKRLEIIQQTLQSQHEEMQKMYIYEKELQIKLEATSSQLESEFESIQLQHDEGFEAQSEDLHMLQESIITMVNNIEEMRQRKISLESELIIYCHLLEIDKIQQHVVIDSPPVQTTVVKTFVIQHEKIGSIGIDCPLDNTYICLVNNSTNEDTDISRWMIKRCIDSQMELEYTLPDGIRLSAGGELRIYSKLGADAAQLSSNDDVISSRLHQKLVSNSVDSWVFGDKIETRLFDENGEEKASCIQTARFEETTYD